jgi:hypothetical protein
MSLPGITTPLAALRDDNLLSQNITQGTATKPAVAQYDIANTSQDTIGFHNEVYNGAAKQDFTASFIGEHGREGIEQNMKSGNLGLVESDGTKVYVNIHNGAIQEMNHQTGQLDTLGNIKDSNVGQELSNAGVDQKGASALFDTIENFGGSAIGFAENTLGFNQTDITDAHSAAQLGGMTGFNTGQ